MKRAILVILIIAAVAAGAFFLFRHKGQAGAPASAATEAKPAEEEAAPKVTRDAKGNAVIAMNDEMQGDMGIQVTNPAPMELSPELRGYGRVLDPGPLTALMNELASVQAVYIGSSNEWTRLKTLTEQGNASIRALQTAEAAARRDQLAVQSARERLVLAWGQRLAEQSDLPALLKSLGSLETVLVRIDLPAGETLPSPGGVRISTLSGAELEGEFVGLSTTVDPQMQGRGFLFLVRSNRGRLSPGEAVAGYLKIPGEPLKGVLIPRQAVVRAEGSGWVYLLDTKGAGESFTRTEISLDRPIDAGFLVTKGVSATDYIVVTGAQDLLSIELKGQGGGEE